MRAPTGLDRWERRWRGLRDDHVFCYPIAAPLLRLLLFIAGWMFLFAYARARLPDGSAIWLPLVFGVAAGALVVVTFCLFQIRKALLERIEVTAAEVRVTAGRQVRTIRWDEIREIRGDRDLLVVTDHSKLVVWNDLVGYPRFREALLANTHSRNLRGSSESV